MARRFRRATRPLRTGKQRCALRGQDEVKPDGSESNMTFGLHGKIANIPASYRGRPCRQRNRRTRSSSRATSTSLVCSARRSSMITRIATVPGSNTLGRPRRVRQSQGPAGGDPDPLPLELRTAVSRSWLAVCRADQVGHAARRAGQEGIRPARSLRWARAGLDRAGLLP